jgi:molybdopterin/thiamine biosynthesis adenylyltransferase
MNINSAEATSRFREAAWYGQELPQTHITIGGVGGVGSWLVLFLNRIGCKLHVYDFDRIEPHNYGGQLFLTESLYKRKTNAIVDLVLQTCSTSNVYTYSKFNSDTEPESICVACFDNMLSRNYMFTNWVDKNSNNIDIDARSLYIDARCTLEQIQIYCVKNTIKDIEKYKEHLLTDDQIEETQCSVKQTSHTAAMIASHITGFITNHIANIIEMEVVREIPFYYEYFTPSNLTVTYENIKKDTIF